VSSPANCSVGGDATDGNTGLTARLVPLHARPSACAKPPYDQAVRLVLLQCWRLASGSWRAPCSVAAVAAGLLHRQQWHAARLLQCICMRCEFVVAAPVAGALAASPTAGGRQFGQACDLVAQSERPKCQRHRQLLSRLTGSGLQQPILLLHHRPVEALNPGPGCPDVVLRRKGIAHGTAARRCSRMAGGQRVCLGRARSAPSPAAALCQHRCRSCRLRLCRGRTHPCCSSQRPRSPEKLQGISAVGSKVAAVPTEYLGPRAATVVSTVSSNESIVVLQ
jgi:hypothetical protein